MYAWLDVDPTATATAADTLQLRQSFGHFTTGVCLVSTVAGDGKREGMTINSFASVSLAPPLLLWSVRDAARSAEVFIAARHFTLSILAAKLIVLYFSFELLLHTFADRMKQFGLVSLGILLGLGVRAWL